VDYAKSRQEALRQMDELHQRREAIVQEKERLDRENGEIERQLFGLEQILEGLEYLSTDVPPDIEAPGFTDQIRQILQETDVPLTAVQIRDSLAAAGTTGSSPKNLLISVHTVLGRIESNLKKTEKDGRAAYVWKHPLRKHYRRGAALGSLAELASLSADMSKLSDMNGIAKLNEEVKALSQGYTGVWNLGAAKKK